MPNVDAYRADIPSLLGVGRKKTAKLPKNLLFSKKIWNSAQPKPLKINENLENSEISSPNSYLVGVLPTPSAQKSILDSLLQHAILHHSNLDRDTIFQYSSANFLTFLHCSVLAQILAANSNFPEFSRKFHFLSHNHRRNSAIFNKFFDLKIIEDDFDTGYSTRSFHPELPTPKKLTHEKKLNELKLFNHLQYPVRIAPQKSIKIAEKWPEIEDFPAFAYFFDLIGKHPNAKSALTVIQSIFPETCLKLAENPILELKIGEIADLDLELIFAQVKSELVEMAGFLAFCQNLKIKRAV
ncbi:unnamed protein product [Caenorhabditis angaria]|uniref:Uncharacterized protein n=1 Tax=Caenorhabditis angaria TaxID=860376 RepID=A0A9P1IRP9_9PELO|nr:unnamed protein product [Caenorhabditis angaria]